MRIICIDTEYDARYTDLGVARLACLTYSFGPDHAAIAGPAEAVKLWREWAEDPGVTLLGHSVYNDVGVLAQELFYRTEGYDCAPGEGWAWELAHRLYDPVDLPGRPGDEFYARCRIIDTEIEQRLTQIRFGPDKASVRLGDLAKMLFGEDKSDTKDVPKEARQLLREAVPYEEWPADVLTRTPYRVLFGYLLEQHGEDPRAWPEAAVEYALEDARLPWRVYEWQRRRWQQARKRQRAQTGARPTLIEQLGRVPDDTRQTMTSWALHVLALPGWRADQQRALAINERYQAVVDNCDDVLIDAGILDVPGEVETAKRVKLQALVIEAFGDEPAPLTKTALKQVDDVEALTPAERQASTATDAKTVKQAIAKCEGKYLALDEALAAHRDGGLPLLLAESGAAVLNAHRLRREAQAKIKKLAKAADADPEIPINDEHAHLLAFVRDSLPILVEAGLIEVSHPRTLKKRQIADLVYSILGDDAPLTKTKAEEIPDPTPEQREEFCSTDSKTVRKAIIEDGGKLRMPADAVAKAEEGPDAFEAWLVESRQPVLNAHALRSKAGKVQSNFLSYLAAPGGRRIRTTYQTVVNTGRTSSRSVNIQQLPRDYDKPAHLHVRGCIVPDPGWCFLVADYTQLELCALAHVLNMLVRAYATDPKRRAFAEDLIGRPIDEHYVSTLAQAINNDQDCHVKMAATLRGFGESYEQAYALYERADEKKGAKQPLDSDEAQIIDDRQLAKPCNFGFPGGLGARKFIDYAAGYGVTIDLATAKRAKAAYESAWVEMKLYFWHVSQMTKDGTCEVMRQLYSKRERGWTFFTQTANGFFQGLAGDGAKEALRRIIRAAYRTPSSDLYGTHPSGFVHDEFLVNCRLEQAERALPALEREMVEGMRVWIPDVKIKAPGKILKERWGK